MPMPTFVVGSRWRPVVRCKAESVAGNGLGPTVLTDPTTLDFKLRTPAGVETTTAIGSLTRRSVGIFYKEVDLNAAGRWVGRYVATGAVVDAIEFYIDVAQSPIASP